MDPSTIPFISIKQGKLVCDFRDGKPKKYPGTQGGAIKLAKDLLKTKNLRFVTSSSINWPLDYGAKDLNYQEIISNYITMNLANNFLRKYTKRLLSLTKNKDASLARSFIKTLLKEWDKITFLNYEE